MMAYRSSVYASIGMTPCSMMLGREITLPVDLCFERLPEEKGIEYISNYAYELEEKLEKIHEYARKNLQISAGKMKENYDNRMHFNKYEKGDAVWLHRLARKKGISPKLQRSWQGPFLVTHRLNDVLYRIQETQRSKPKVVHSNRLKPYVGENQPNFDVKEKQTEEIIFEIADSTILFKRKCENPDIVNFQESEIKDCWGVSKYRKTRNR